MKPNEVFVPRLFMALKNEYGLDDVGFSGMTVEVLALKKGKIYEEADNRWREDKHTPVVIDDNGCVNVIGSEYFKKIFKEVFTINIISTNLDKYAKLSNLNSGPVRSSEPSSMLFKTIEHAYQVSKCMQVSGDKSLAYQIMMSETGLAAKLLSKKIQFIKMTERQWNKVKFDMIKKVMKRHYEDPMNSERTGLLLSTGDNILTHKHPTLNLGKWEKEFPRILMEIRTELKEANAKRSDS